MARIPSLSRSARAFVMMISVGGRLFFTDERIPTGAETGQARHQLKMLTVADHWRPTLSSSLALSNRWGSEIH